MGRTERSVSECGRSPPGGERSDRPDEGHQRQQQEDDGTPNDKRCLQVRESIRNAEECDGNGSYHQVNKDGDNDRQWPNPDQLAKCKAFPRGWASGSGCHIIFLSNVSNVHSIRRPPLTSDLVHCLGEECTY